MKTINFVTLYLECRIIDLKKDAGQIPLYLSNYYNCSVATSVIDENEDVGGIVSGVNIISVPNIVNRTLSGIIFLIKNAKKIDILNMYHCRKRVYIYTRLYKFLNKDGIVYIKLDAGNTTLEKIRNEKEYRKLFKKLSHYADVVSAESKVILDRLQEYSEKKIYLIPNGVPYAIDLAPTKNNFFITAGRIGAPEKNNEVMLEAFAKICDECDWELHFVGKVEESFSEYIDAYMQKHPNLRKRVKFYGEITSRERLYELYAESKIFMLTSKFENFSLACVEALANGCYLILSDQVSPKLDFTDNWKYGVEAKVNDVDDLARQMLRASQTNIDKKMMESIIEYTRENFLWENICDKLHNILLAKER